MYVCAVALAPGEERGVSGQFLPQQQFPERRMRRAALGGGRADDGERQLPQLRQVPGRRRRTENEPDRREFVFFLHGRRRRQLRAG